MEQLIENGLRLIKEQYELEEKERILSQQLGLPPWENWSLRNLEFEKRKLEEREIEEEISRQATLARENLRQIALARKNVIHFSSQPRNSSGTIENRSPRTKRIRSRSPRIRSRSPRIRSRSPRKRRRSPSPRRENVEPSSRQYKTKICKYWLEFGVCARGTKCMFAHGMRELRQL